MLDVTPLHIRITRYQTPGERKFATMPKWKPKVHRSGRIYRATSDGVTFTGNAAEIAEKIGAPSARICVSANKGQRLRGYKIQALGDPDLGPADPRDMTD